MKRPTAVSLAFTLALLAAPGFVQGAAAKKAAAAPAAPADYAAKQANVQLEGDSTLHRWHVHAETVNVKASLAAKGSVAESLKAGGLSLSAVVPVTSLKSGKDQMDNNMYKAMNSKDQPEVKFELKGLQGAPGEATKAQGSLTINGQSKDVEFAGESQILGSTIHFEGKTEIKQTEYGIKPPVLMLGTIKVDDKVLISIHVDLVPAAEMAGAATKSGVFAPGTSHGAKAEAKPAAKPEAKGEAKPEAKAEAKPAEAKK